MINKTILLKLEMFYEQVFSSLLPMMFLIPFLINYGMIELINDSIGKIMKRIYKFSDNGIYLFCISIISGFPGNAINAKELLDNNKITVEEVNEILKYNHFASPLYVLSISNPKILICHYLPNFILPLFNKKEYIKINYNTKEKNSFFKVFSNSINTTTHTVLYILGIYLFCIIISEVIPMGILKYILELSNSVFYITNSPYKDYLLLFILSFGGLAIHIQVFGILENYNINYKKYLVSRIIQGILSILFYIII